MAEQLEYGIKLKSLKINNFRCFEKLDIVFDDKLTVFIAENGGGKTALLDAVAEGLKAYLFALKIEKTPCSFNAKDVTIGRDNKTENDLEVEVTYPVQLDGLKEEDELDQVNEDAPTTTYSPTSAKSGKQKTESETRDAEAQELEMDSRTEEGVKLHVDISTDGDSEYQLSNSSVVDSFQRHAAQRINKESGENIVLPVLLYHGGSSPDFSEKADDKPRSIRTGYIYENALSSSRMNFSAFYRWFEARYILFLQEKSNDPAIELEQFDPEISKIKWAIEEIMNDNPTDKNYHDLRVLYTKQGAKMVLGKKNDKGTFDDIEIKQLSSGEKALFALVADLGFRLLNAHPIEKRDTEVKDPVSDDTTNSIWGKGIVLIDEVDLHLHLKWQEKVIDKLLKIFPDVQWVMTTHSLLVLGKLRSANVRLISDNELYSIPEVYGQDIATIIEKIWRIPSSTFKPRIQEVYRLLASNNPERIIKAREELDKIEKEIGTPTTALTEAKAIIAHKEKALAL